jgi:hypothetical protein
VVLSIDAHNSWGESCDGVLVIRLTPDHSGERWFGNPNVMRLSNINQLQFLAL